MTSFEDRLLSELRAVVDARPLPEVVVPPPLRRSPRARLTLAGGAVAATAVAAVIVASSGDRPAPAYAVERQHDGSVTVAINSLRDAAGLQEKLRAAGVPAVVDYTPMGKACREPRGRHAPHNGRMSTSGTAKSSGAATFTVTPGELSPGETLVITSSVGASASSVGMQVVDGAVAPCELVDAPSAPDPGAGFSTGGAAGQSLSGSAETGDAPATQTAP
jgi:hypothetical protein